MCKNPLDGFTAVYRLAPPTLTATAQYGQLKIAPGGHHASERGGMSRYRRILIGLAVVGASFIPSAAASAGLATNHSETLLSD